MGLGLIVVDSEDKEDESAPEIHLGYSVFNLWRHNLPVLDEDPDFKEAIDIILDHPDNGGIWSYEQCVLMKKYLEHVKKTAKSCCGDNNGGFYHWGWICYVYADHEYCLYCDYWIDSFLELFSYIVEKGDKKLYIKFR